MHAHPEDSERLNSGGVRGGSDFLDRQHSAEARNENRLGWYPGQGSGIAPGLNESDLVSGPRATARGSFESFRQVGQRELLFPAPPVRSPRAAYPYSLFE